MLFCVRAAAGLFSVFLAFCGVILLHVTNDMYVESLHVVFNTFHFLSCANPIFLRVHVLTGF